MNAATVWCFAYGSNMNRATMQQRAGQILEMQSGHLENYSLVFNKMVRGGSAEANVQQARGETVHGVLYRIPESALRTLDRSTGVPDHYRRIQVDVVGADGKPINAHVYIASKVGKGLRPAAHYLQTLLQSAGEHGLPADYIAVIKAAAGA